MNSSLAIKLVIAFITGFCFWFFVFLVMMAYAFMPEEKASHSVFFAMAAPLAYLIGTTYLFNKLFKNKGFKESIINFLLISVMAGVSIMILDFIARLV